MRWQPHILVGNFVALLSVAPTIGTLPPYTPALGDYLWERATLEIDELGEDGYANHEKFVCGAGNWGDGPQCNQWDQGYSPCWPGAMTVSASWDIRLMELWSEELAEEFGGAGRGQLGPGINLARFAWNGRLGEYMAGEDPYFGAKMVAAMVTAYRRAPHPPLQTAKHFIPNTIEKSRTHMTEVVDERTLFEVYYPPFEAAVNAGISGVMCSYNLVQCTTGICDGTAAYACANDDILNKHLKGKIGFKGVVVSDWDATKCQHNAAQSPGCSSGGYLNNDFASEAGLDLEMPVCRSFKGGAVKRAREKAIRLTWAYLMQGRFRSGEEIAARKLHSNSVSFVLRWRTHPDKCFQAQAHEFKNGSALQMWDCTGHTAQQFFWHKHDSKIHWAAYPNLCLDVTGHYFSNGVHIQLWECLEDDPDQKFILNATGTGKIRSFVHSHMCLDVTGHATWDGTPIQIWDCVEDDKDQVFELVAADDPELLRDKVQTSAKKHSSKQSKKTGKTPSWTTGIYEENPFGNGKPSLKDVKKDTSSGQGELPKKANGPEPGRRCKDNGDNNYKSLCKLALADRIIAESTTILKNEGGMLPLNKAARVALVGKEACARDPIAQSGGSGWNGYACNQVPKINVRDGIAGLSSGPELACPDAEGDNPGATEADIVLIVVAAPKSFEGKDRRTLQLEQTDTNLILKYSDMGKNVVVAINAPGPMITSTWESKVVAITVSWLPGQQNGRGIAMALFNEEYAASGRLPFTFPRCSTEACTVADEFASVALGDKIAGDQYRTFSEKALIGYRWYHSQGLEVSYPFGFGLFAYGKATIKYSDAISSTSGQNLKVIASLSHDGAQSGWDVPQLYLSFPVTIPGAPESKPQWVLKGFSKVLVEPGVPAVVEFDLTARDMSYWDDSPGQSRWVCASGEFKACVGANSRDATLLATACMTFSAPCAEGGFDTMGATSEMQQSPVFLNPATSVAALCFSGFVLLILGCSIAGVRLFSWFRRRPRQQDGFLALDSEAIDR